MHFWSSRVALLIFRSGPPWPESWICAWKQLKQLSLCLTRWGQFPGEQQQQLTQFPQNFLRQSVYFSTRWLQTLSMGDVDCSLLGTTIQWQKVSMPFSVELWEVNKFVLSWQPWPQNYCIHFREGALLGTTIQETPECPLNPHPCHVSNHQCRRQKLFKVLLIIHIASYGSAFKNLSLYIFCLLEGNPQELKKHRKGVSPLKVIHMGLSKPRAPLRMPQIWDSGRQPRFGPQIITFSICSFPAANRLCNWSHQDIESQNTTVHDWGLLHKGRERN